MLLLFSKMEEALHLWPLPLSLLLPPLSCSWTHHEKHLCGCLFSWMLMFLSLTWMCVHSCEPTHTHPVIWWCQGRLFPSSLTWLLSGTRTACVLYFSVSLYTRFVKQHTEQRRSEEQQGKFPVEGSNTYKHTSPHEHDGHSGGATTHCAIQMTATKERQYYKPERKLQWKCCSSCFNHLGFFFLFSCYHINIVFLQHADRCTEHRGSDNTTPTWLLTQNAGWGSVFKIFYKTW